MKKPVLDMSRFTKPSALNTRFIEERFDQSVVSMRFMLEKPRYPQGELPWGCPSLSQVQSINQRLTQDQMRNICESIQQDTDQGCNCTVVNLGEKYQLWGDEGFALVESAIQMKIVGSEAVWGDLLKYDRANTTIYVRSDENKISGAFLKYNGVDGGEYFFQLTELSLLSFVMPSALTDAEIDTMGSKEFSNSISCIFTLYDMHRNFMFIDNASLTIELILEEMNPVRL